MKPFFVLFAAAFAPAATVNNFKRDDCSCDPATERVICCSTIGCTLGTPCTPDASPKRAVDVDTCTCNPSTQQVECCNELGCTAQGTPCTHDSALVKRQNCDCDPATQRVICCSLFGCTLGTPCTPDAPSKRAEAVYICTCSSETRQVECCNGLGCTAPEC
ncbi:hypothetical protein B0T17DRAFT_503550 [Bombardia bombarda]|uniref:Uncharacterized protein n=1 Tax=Bombardia bombarda TaxID=252184 RepID=A0AA40CF03_9PEZI|nr:hypothetical protein B0T17DRAFT_503550 [Bombardia bombarda]